MLIVPHALRGNCRLTLRVTALDAERQEMHSHAKRAAYVQLVLLLAACILKLLAINRDSCRATRDTARCRPECPPVGCSPAAPACCRCDSGSAGLHACRCPNARRSACGPDSFYCLTGCPALQVDSSAVLADALDLVAFRQVDPRIVARIQAHLRTVDARAVGDRAHQAAAAQHVQRVGVGDEGTHVFVAGLSTISSGTLY
jgi:hypothetical protein